MHPIIFRTMGRTGEINPVRRMGDCAGHHVLDTDVAKQRKTFSSFFQPWHQAVQLRCNQLAFKIPCRRLSVPAHMGRCGFIGADENTVGFFADVGMAVGIAHHRQFRRKGDQLFHRFSDEVVMQHIGNGHIVAGPRANHIGIRPGRIDHMFTDDVALIGDNFPFA